MVWCGRRHRCRQRCCVGVCVLDFCLRWMRPLFACVSAERDREVAARTPDVMCPHRSRRKWTKRKQSAGCCRLEFCMLIEKKNGCTHFCLETTVHIELCVNSQRMPVRTMAQHPLFTAIRYDQHALMTRSHSFYRSPIALLLSLKWTNGFGSNKRHRQIIQTSLVQIRNSIDGRDIVLRRGILYRHRCHPQRQTLDDVMHIQTVETFNVIDTIENEPRFEFNQFSHEFSKKKKTFETVWASSPPLPIWTVWQWDQRNIHSKTCKWSSMQKLWTSNEWRQNFKFFICVSIYFNFIATSTESKLKFAERRMDDRRIDTAIILMRRWCVRLLSLATAGKLIQKKQRKYER